MNPKNWHWGRTYRWADLTGPFRREWMWRDATGRRTRMRPENQISWGLGYIRQRYGSPDSTRP